MCARIHAREFRLIGSYGMTDITIAGETFNVLIEGDENKEVLMLSNPMGTNLHLWDAQVPALAEHFRIVRYDSRGHGASVANQGPYSVEGLGRDALAIMDALGIERAHWLGLSMGSIVGLWLLVHARERIGRAVLASTAAQIPGPDLWNNRIQSARNTGMNGVAMAAAERWFTKTFRAANPGKVDAVMAMVRATPLHGYLAALAAIRDMDQREAIRSIRSTVLVIAGRHDLSTPPGMGALVASSIEGAKFVTLEASHLSNIEDEANFTKAAIDFLAAPETTAARPPPGARAPAKKAAAKKAPARKKAPAKKTAAKKAPVKKIVPKKPAGKRASAKKAPTKKTPPKKLKTKAPTNKAAAKKTTARAVQKKRPGTKKGVKKRRQARENAE
jgi:3-oxoadipate enol-lactonase